MPDATDPIEGGVSLSSEPVAGFGTATASFVIVSSMIGVGVLTTSGLAVAHLGSNQLMLWLWLVGGLNALCGALSLAEVSAALPRSGGEYSIFREVYGPAPAFLAGWVSILFGFSAPIAMSASGASGYLLAPFGDGWSAEGVTRPALATALIVTMTAAHASGRGRSAKIQGSVTLFELIFLVSFAVAGIWSGRSGLANLDDRPPVDGDTIGRMCFSLIYIGYGYTGWNAASYLAGEVVNPGRQLPRAILLGTMAVTALYLGLNSVYALALPSSEILALAAHDEESVVPIAQLAAQRLFGTMGADVLTIGIGLILVANLSALLLTGPRVLFAMAKDRRFPAIAARISWRTGTPVAASTILASWGILLLWTGSFDAILVYTGLGLTIMSMLAVASVIVLRWRRPELPRPFRVPGYPWVPALFILANIALTLIVVVTEPVVAVLSVLSIAAGYPLYLIQNRLGESELR